MDTQVITTRRLAESVIAEPPLARDSNLHLNTAQNQRIIQHIEAGGVTTLLYGSNAGLYHCRPSEYATLLQMLVEATAEKTLVIPAVGPAYGTMMDQAEVLRDFDFPTVMLLPATDVCDPGGITAGIRRFAESFGRPIVLNIKHDRWLPAETIGKMHASGLVSSVIYAVPGERSAQDSYLQKLLEVIPPEIVVSGSGEQAAISHLRDFGLGSFTSSCVCVRPELSVALLQALQATDYARATQLSECFAPLDALQVSIDPSRVLHRAVELAGIADTGPMLPLLGELTIAETTAVAEAAEGLLHIAN